MAPISRRSVLTTAGGAIVTASLGSLPAFGRDVSAGGSGLTCSDTDFEQIVASIIDAPKKEVVGVVANCLRQGHSTDVLHSSVFHAAVRAEKRFGVSGYPHAMLTVRSARQLAGMLPESMKFFPLFCTLEPLKNEQGYATARTAMQPLKERLVPNSADEAAKQFSAAMESWEPEQADAAIVGLFRAGGSSAVLEPLFRYATRKNIGIGHFPILVAQATQSLATFGWDCAEPVLRQMGQALALQPGPYDMNIFERNTKILDEQPLRLDGTRSDAGATRELLAMARQSRPEPIVRELVTMLRSGISVRSCWDAVILCGAEIVLRDAAGDAHGMARLTPSAIGIHQVDAANALRRISDQTQDEVTRSLCLLQAVAWMPHFVRSARFAKTEPGITIDALEPSGSVPQTLNDIFVAVGTDNLEAGRRALAWVKAGRSIDELKAKSLELAVRKFSDPHHFKFPVALFEEADLADRHWRPVMLATQAMYARLAADPDWNMLEEVREAVASISA